MFSLFIPNETFFYSDINEHPIEKDICFICWMPNEKDNMIKKLSDFSHITITCKCKPQIHQLCLNNWISKHTSCPICRTKIIVSKQQYLTYYNFVKYTTYSLKLLFYINLLNFMYNFFYNIYILTFFDDYTDIY
jgi:hypothetical protein